MSWSESCGLMVWLLLGTWWCLWNTNVIYYTACPQLSCLCENFWREKLLMASIIEIISQHYVTLPKLNETNTERIAALWERLWDTGRVVSYWKIITIRYFEIYFVLKTNQRFEIDMARSKVGSSGSTRLDYNDFWPSPRSCNIFTKIHPHQHQPPRVCVTGGLLRWCM